jgi:hypothetical protein
MPFGRYDFGEPVRGIDVLRHRVDDFPLESDCGRPA